MNTSIKYNGISDLPSSLPDMIPDGDLDGDLDGDNLPDNLPGDDESSLPDGSSGSDPSSNSDIHLRYRLFLLDFETVAGKGPCRRFGISLHRPLQNYVSTFSLFSKPPAGPGRQGIFFPLSFKIRIAPPRPEQWDSHGCQEFPGT